MYIGKGGLARMEVSIGRILKEFEAGGESVKLTEKSHTPMANAREALKQESREIEAAGGPLSKNPESKLLNKYDSPGTKYRIQDGELGPSYDHR